MSEIEYAQAIYEFTEANNSTWLNGLIVFDVIIDQASMEFAKQLDDQAPNNDYEIKRNGQSISIYDLIVGDSARFEIVPPRNQRLFYAEDLDDLLKFKSSLVNKPENIVIQNQRYISWKLSNNTPLNILAYVKICKFLNTLVQLNILEQKVDEQLLLFFNDSTLLLRAKTTNSVLSQYSSKIINGIDSISEIIEGELHKEDKRRILKAILFTSLKSSQEEQRLDHFLGQCDEIAKDFSNNYDLYVSEFSFEIEYEKVIQQQQEFSNRLSTILTSIQGRILAIPLSLILAFGQMKTEPKDNPLFVNTAVIVAAFVFSILMWYLLSSQNQVLVVIKEELDSKVRRFKVSIPKLFSQMEDVFKSLDEQYKSTERMLNLLKFLIIWGFVLTMIAYIYLTPEIRNAVELLLARI